MEALKILGGITAQMTKTSILNEVARAITELDLKDTAQVATLLGVKKETVYKRAAYHDIGTLIAPRARVYSPSDIEQLRKLIFEYKGQQPTTLAMIAEMHVMREQGRTLAQIGREFDVSESYVSKLLREQS